MHKTQKTKKRRERPLYWLELIICFAALIGTITIEPYAYYQNAYGQLSPKLFYLSAIVVCFDVSLLIWIFYSIDFPGTGKYCVRMNLGDVFLYPVVARNNDGFINDPESVNYDDRYTDYEFIETYEKSGSKGQQYGPPGYLSNPNGHTLTALIDDRTPIEKAIGGRYAGLFTKRAYMLHHTHMAKQKKDLQQSDVVSFEYNDGEYVVVESKNLISRKPLFWTDVIICERMETGAGSYGRTSAAIRTELEEDASHGHDLPANGNTPTPQVQLLSVNLTIKCQFRIRNVYTIFTKSVDTHRAALMVITAVVRDFVGTVDIDQLQAIRHTEEGLKTLVPKINEILRTFGFEVAGALFLEGIDPADDMSKKMFDAQRKTFIAFKEGEQLNITATAEAQATETTANAQANAYKTVRDAQATSDKKYVDDVTIPVIREKNEKYTQLGKVTGTLVLNESGEGSHDVPTVLPLQQPKQLKQKTAESTEKPAHKHGEKKDHPQKNNDNEHDEHH